MITFGANYISTANIKKYSPSKQYTDCAANIVQLMPESKRDFKAIREVAGLWRNADFARDIRDHFEGTRVAPRRDSNPKFYYALTKQKNDFENLDSSSVLGIAEVTNNSEGNFRIDYIQVDPKYEYNEERKSASKYKSIGSAMMKTFEKILDFRKITVTPVFSACEFYEKLGYKVDIANLDMYLKK
ncbi:MAG: GNAT family N-acetyltransferase [Cyanobacteria bacterium SIG28]|nr:GNAT family N-acetyltransferase [Cyanobacteria bacterium SIG28]